MVTNGCAVNAITTDATRCSTCFGDTGLTLTLPCIACGKYIAHAVMTVSNTSSNQTKFRWVEGATNHGEHIVEVITGNKQAVTMALTGNTDGDTLKMQWRVEAGTSTLYGTNVLARSHINVFGTNGATPITLTTTNNAQSATVTDNNCTYDTLTGTPITLTCVACGTGLGVAVIGWGRNGTGGNTIAFRIDALDEGQEAESNNANYAHVMAAVVTNATDGTTLNPQVRRGAAGCGQSLDCMISCCCLAGSFHVLEVTP